MVQHHEVCELKTVDKIVSHVFLKDNGKEVQNASLTAHEMWKGKQQRGKGSNS